MEAVTDTEHQNADAPAAAESDRWRDALFENLALETGLIDSDELAKAKEEQSLSPARILADVLVERQAISEKARQGLELLLEEQSRQHESPLARTNASTRREVPASGSSVRVDETLSLATYRTNVRPSPQYFAGYELQSEIARGGMGVVYRARQIKLNRDVALKMILSGEFSGDDQIRRFYSEAEAAAKLDHPNIVPVYEVGEANGQHYYSMALIAGQSLHEIVKNNGPLPPRQAAQFMKLVAHAVQYAHDKGIVHRDLKPQNILLEGDEHPKITDFGLAKHVNSLSDLTLSGQVIGTPSYMPPEQAAGKGDSVGPLADVYAMGATLYYLLAGHSPFHGSSPAETIRQVLETEPVPLRRLNREIPRDLETICLKCLRKEQGDRYESAAAVAMDLRRWLANEPIVARPVSHLERAWLWCRRRPAMAAFLTVSILLVATAAAVTHERMQQVRAAGLVDAIVTSDTRDVERLVSQAQPYRRWTAPLLRQKLAEVEANPKQKLHASLSLAANDSQQADFLLERLAGATPEEAVVIGRALIPYQEKVTDRLWRAMENPGERNSRLRFASALALTSNVDIRWQKWCGEVASLLVTTPLFEAKPWVTNLRPVGTLLTPELERIYREPSAAGSAERRVAAAALADLSGDPQQILELALLAESGDELLPLLTALRMHKAVAVPSLQKVLQQPIPVESHEKPRDALWKAHDARDQAWQRHANAAVCLLNLEEDASPWELLRYSRNPTLRSYLIERLHLLGTPYGLLASRLRRETEADVQRALILSLGTYDPIEISAGDQAQIVEELLLLYQSSADSGVHSAIDWTLRRWHQTEALRAGAPVGTVAAPAGKGNWLMNSRGETFVRVTAPVTLTMFEKTNQTVPTAVTLNYPYAIATREVTAHEFRQFAPTWEYDATYAPQLDCPMHNAMKWQQAAEYCNWLSNREGLPSAQWAYEGDRKSGLTLAADFASRPGYRLPTEAEWEYVCKAGTTTIFSCGETVEVLDAYSWHQDNAAAKCWPVGSKMPNDLGLFDMHGNVMEWCHKQVADPSGKVAVVFGPENDTCALRGGSFFLGPMGVRSDWRRVLSPPQEFYRSMGFRLARSLPGK